MGYKQTRPTVYVVHWPAIDVFKVGCTERQRWRMYLLRGAQLIALHEFDSVSAAYGYEGQCHRLLESLCSPGFGSTADAEPYVGVRGDGYLECYQLPTDVPAIEIAALIAAELDTQASGEHSGRAYAPTLLETCPSNAHTDRHTYKHQPTLASYLTLSNARRGVAPKFPSTCDQPRPAALRAGSKQASHV